MSDPTTDKTYDDLESEIEQQEAHILYRILPTGIALTLINSDVDPRDIRSKRNTIKTEYEQLCDEINEKKSTLKEGLSACRQSSDILPDTTVDIARNADQIEESVSSFRSTNNRFLREDEHDRLRELCNEITEVAERIRSHRRETAQKAYHSSIQKAEELEKSVRTALANARRTGDPLSDTIIERAAACNSLREELLTVSSSHSRYLTDDEHERITTLREQLETRAEEFRDRRRRDARTAHEQIVAEVESLQSPLSEAVNRVRRSGDPLPEEYRHSDERCETLRNELTECRTEHAGFLEDDEKEQIVHLREQLAETAEYVAEKRRLDAILNESAEERSALSARIEPYLEYNRYLTQPSKETLETLLQDAKEAVDPLNDLYNDVLGEGDKLEIKNVFKLLEIAEACLNNYNESYVKHKRKEYSDLFTNVDDAGNDLNLHQQQAVVRDGIYNQVIAAAGTGKTLALTYRIAYLIYNGVDPSNIAALTYTKEAAKEMEQRLADEFQIENVDVRNLHSFAFRIAQQATAFDRDVAQSRDKHNLVEEVIREETERGGEFETHYVQFLAHYDDDQISLDQFEDKTDYVAERRRSTYGTLAGETVASHAEKVIADFLFTHNISYQYNSIVEWAETDNGPYRPEFYLPDYDCYIEHWGIDENGEVADWFDWSTKKYHNKIRWAREQFSETEFKLIETYEFEHEVGTLEQALTHRLREYGVDLEKLGFEEFLDSTFEYNEKEDDVLSSFTDFISNAKTFNIEPQEIDRRVTKDDPRQYHFAQCSQLLLKRYNQFLETHELLDFEDMIYDAIDVIRANPEQYADQYEHVLVDEFQDVSMSQIQLIENFVGPDRAHLFCVGDDWQSIYSFQGSEVRYFVDFAEFFGSPVQTFLTTNYRCPEPVLDSGNELIRKNEEQIEKTVEAAKTGGARPVLHRLGGEYGSYSKRVASYAAELVAEWIDEGVEPGEIMVLCRYDRGAPYLRLLKNNFANEGIPYDGKRDHYRPNDMPGERDDAFDPEAGVSTISVHQSKGREAKRVLILHASTGPVGFPPDERDDDLIAPVQDVETNTRAEERRLFYVAMTRATEELHIQTQSGYESPFIYDIEEYLDEVETVAPDAEDGETISVTAVVDQLFDDIHDKKHQDGVLRNKTGTARFVSWKNSDPPTLEAETWYKFEDITVNEWNDQTQFVITDQTTAIKIYQYQDGIENRDLSQPGPQQHSNVSTEPKSAVTTDGRSVSTTDTSTTKISESQPNDHRPPVIKSAPTVDIEYDDIKKSGGPIGHGTSGKVYGAHITATDEQIPVAIKEPDQEQTLRKETVDQFIREGELSSKISEHDHIVDIVDVGTSPLPWIAMEYMDGGHLGQWAGEMTVAQSLWTAISLAKALRHAHLSGVQHLDLKPENVLFRTVGREYWPIPKICDWGIAADGIGDSTNETYTPAYAAPEQFSGGSIDNRTDIYQLGMICYELFTGKHPYGGDGTEALSTDPTPPTVHNSDLPPAVDEIILKAIAVDPDDRHPDIIDLRRGFATVRGEL
jgi:DNA helicase-4